MLARLARRILLAELALYALAAWGAYRFGLNAYASAVLVPLLAMLARMLAVAATFTIARALASPGEHCPKAPPGVVLRETLWTALAYSVLMPLPRLADPQDSRLRAAPGVVPVLLVHGYLCNRGIWGPMRRGLEASGVPAYTHDLEPVYAGIDDYVPALAARIEDVCAQSGATQLALVGHSMGGLVARAYLRAHGPARVARLITLGTPHHGTRSAPFGLGENARQMRVGSDWLQKLARDEAGAPARIPVTSIYTENDNVVVPAASSVLPDAENVALSGLGHVSLAFDGEVKARVLAHLRGAG